MVLDSVVNNFVFVVCLCVKDYVLLLDEDVLC